MMLKRFVLLAIPAISLLILTHSVTALNTSVKVAVAYPKGSSNFDIVARDTPNTKLTLKIANGTSSSAKTNGKGWATFKKVYLINTGKITLTEQGRSKSLNKFYVVANQKVTFYDNDPAASSAIGNRTKTSGCKITSNREQDIQCTPGAVFTNATKEMVCKKGYSASVRNVSSSTKSQVYSEYGVTSHKSGEYEVDHLVSLELGGSNSIANLWPEAANPTPGFHQKDAVENKLHSEVCSGTIGLAEAQQQIADNWLNIYLDLYPAVRAQPTPVVSHPAPQTVAPLPQPIPPPATSAVVKMSSTGICHAPGTTYYDRTINYTPYSTLQACLSAGGRLPLR